MTAIATIIDEKDFEIDYKLSRIDRSVADNLRDIEKSFGQDSGIITDFIVFITTLLKTDLFGYTRFTLKDFCRESGRNKQDLCLPHPFFKDNPKESPPEHHGHTFATVFDYALYNMLQKNIIFSKSYNDNESGRIIQLGNFSIIKDIKLNIDRQSNGIKIYEIRVSDELLHGFLQRYYTIESNGYKRAGKGRGGDGRKRLFLYLYKTRHQVLSQKSFKTKIPVDFLASIAGIDVKINSQRKNSVKRVLEIIQVKGNLPFTFSFVQGDPSKKHQEDYFVLLNFEVQMEVNNLFESRGDNLFFKSLMENLKFLYKTLYNDPSIEGEKDPFQRWLTDSKINIEEKSNVYCSSYYKAYNSQITLAQAKQFIRAGIK
ncbi:MAG: hypothetical protein WBP45_14860 [Daejeonella sp.]